MQSASPLTPIRGFAAWQFYLAQPASPLEDAGLDDAAWLSTDDEEDWELEPSTMRYAGDLEQAPPLMVPTHETPRLRALFQLLQLQQHVMSFFPTLRRPGSHSARLIRPRSPVGSYGLLLMRVDLLYIMQELAQLALT